jgi:hypothetical protein
VSSSSSDNARPAGGQRKIAGLLLESFAVIRAELSPAFGLLLTALARQTIRIEVDDEMLEVRVDGDELCVASTVFGSPSARVATELATILDVLDARVSLRDAVLENRLRVVAELASVEVLHEALLLYTHAAVRCPSFPELLERLRMPEPSSFEAEQSA